MGYKDVRRLGYGETARRNNLNMSELVFTSSALLDFLSQIDELSDYSVSIQETNEGITVEIGDSTYHISSSSAEDVVVDSEAIDEISDIREDGFDQIDAETDESIEGGILKEIAKTLLIGGMVRLTDKLLDKNRK